MTTPLRRQYLDIKRRYPHAIVFFRLGDFYETFDEDAQTVSRELEITLTSRPVGKDGRVPLAGIPHHALDSYLGKLVGKGHKVAICEQVEEPAKGKKLVDRRVVRVVTPGTLVEENLLPAGNNYLAALVQDEGSDAAELCGLAHVDISTGEFGCLQAQPEAAATELTRLRPAELLLSPGSEAPSGITPTITPLSGFRAETALNDLLRHFGAASLEGLGLAGQRLGAAAAGAIIGYLSTSQPAALGHMARITSDNPGCFMLLDASTRRNLEIFESLPGANAEAAASGQHAATLLGVIDHTTTAMGSRLLRRWLGQPLLDPETIERRQECVQFFFDSAVRRAQTASILARIPDLERVVARISMVATAGTAPTTPRDLVALRRGLESVPRLREALEEASDPENTSPIVELVPSLHPCEEAAQIIAAAIEDEPQQERLIRPGFSDELDALRATTRDVRQMLADVEQRERERTGVKSLKIGYNRVFGYYIEVSKANARLVPADYQRKQTLTGGERYTTPELQELEYRVLHAEERSQELEQQLLLRVCLQVAADSARILETAGTVARVDVFRAFAEAAALYGYVRPVVDESDVLDVKDGRHPVVERLFPEGTFVPNDVHLSATEEQIIVLTGPNMAGKSTYLRQVALTAIMAQAGCFVPAAEARIGLVDRIFSRVGALDDIATGRSTFMVEMLETAAILHNSTPRSLLVFDEIGRGTSTYDGMAIARAVVEFLHNRPDAAARSLFATHYHELVQMASFLPRLRNYNVAVAEQDGRVVFLHRILPGGADRSYGVHVAQLAGLPRPVVLRAQAILEELESARERGRPERRTANTAPQLSLFGRDDALASELARLDVESMTPMQAMTKLYELVERARQSAG